MNAADIEEARDRMLTQAFVAGQMDAQLKYADDLTRPSLALLKERAYLLARESADALIAAVSADAITRGAPVETPSVDQPASPASSEPLPNVGDVLAAANNADWQQVVLNGGPPCFHFDAEHGRFCLAAERWAGHGKLHPFTGLADMIGMAIYQANQSVIEAAQIGSGRSSLSEARTGSGQEPCGEKELDQVEPPPHSQGEIERLQAKLRGCELGRNLSAWYHESVRKEFDLPDPSTNAIVDRLRATITERDAYRAKLQEIISAREAYDAQCVRVFGGCVNHAGRTGAELNELIRACDIKLVSHASAVEGGSQ